LSNLAIGFLAANPTEIPIAKLIARAKPIKITMIN